MYDKISLYLSKDGDRIKLKKSTAQGGQVVTEGGPNVYPLLLEALKCKSLTEVLEFLQKIQADKKCQQWVAFYHNNGPSNFEHITSIGAFFEEGKAHKETIDQMVHFVELRQKESPSDCLVM